jgi:hypothetical protein
MPRLIPSRLVAACALALILLLSFVALAPAKMGGVPAELRVVGKGGKQLVQKALRTHSLTAPTSRKANCFGKGTGGSGKGVKLKGASALGLLVQAARSTPALQPLTITDHFLSEFGLGLCGVGGYSAAGAFSWHLKVNHKSPNLGGELVKLKPGDEVLWALVKYPYPDELSLVAPFSAHPGVPFQVTVFSYDDKGKKKPAAGATVTGALTPTDAAGHTMVTLIEATELVARHGEDVPSNVETVVTCDPSGACPVP